MFNMKSLTVLVLCFLCCANAYRIFPLPGQAVQSNPKFGSLGLPTLRSIDRVTKAPEFNSRLTSFTPRPSFSQSGTQSQTSTSQVRTTFGNFARPLSIAKSVPSTFQTYKAVTISANTQESKSKGSSNRKFETTSPAEKNTFGNVARPLSITQTVVPSTSQKLTAVKILNRPSTNNQAPTYIQKPQNFAVEPPANDLLPPKKDSKPRLPIKGITSTVPPRPTVEAPFNDLLPPKTI